jgi:UPF0716 protein FxsA
MGGLARRVEKRPRRPDVKRSLREWNPPLPALFLVFLLVPLVEIYILIEVGQVIGALPTVTLCVATAVVGAGLLRQQGLATMNRARGNIDRGQVPAMEMLEGVALVIGGALLLTPGLATDGVGFCCLVPWTRRALVRLALRRMQVRYTPGGSGPGGGAGPDRRTIEGEYRREE